MKKLVYLLLVLVAVLSWLLAGLARTQIQLVEIARGQNEVIADLQRNLSGTMRLMQSTLRDMEAVSSQVAVWQEMEQYPPGWNVLK